MRRPRQNRSTAFKAKVTLEAVRGGSPLAELADKYDVHTTQIAQWKADLLKGAEAVFEGNRAKKPNIEVQRLHAKIIGCSIDCLLQSQTDFLMLNWLLWLRWIGCTWTIRLQALGCYVSCIVRVKQWAESEWLA